MVKRYNDTTEAYLCHIVKKKTKFFKIPTLKLEISTLILDFLTLKLEFLNIFKIGNS